MLISRPGCLSENWIWHKICHLFSIKLGLYRLFQFCSILSARRRKMASFSALSFFPSDLTNPLSKTRQKCYKILNSLNFEKYFPNLRFAEPLYCQKRPLTPTLAAIRLWNRLCEKTSFWISSMIFRYYPWIHFHIHFLNQNCWKKFLDQKKIIYGARFS